MIASLKGELVQKTANGAVLDVGGVGYEVFLSTNSLAALPSLGTEAYLHVYTSVREDAINLYGFDDIEEKKMFQLLITISGVGPKLALAILSGIRPADLAAAIMAKDAVRLTGISGVGKKTAARLCVELKDKVGIFSDGDDFGFIADDAGRIETSVVNDVVSALINLGYPQNRAREALSRVKKRLPAERIEAMQVEELLRETLRSLA